MANGDVGDLTGVDVGLGHLVGRGASDLLAGGEDRGLRGALDGRKRAGAGEVDLFWLNVRECDVAALLHEHIAIVPGPAPRSITPIV
ncbi:MAG TPA: hypothetical protein VM848_07690 [Acidimicrobiia bacterium]|nr:hypothetical protein [Acidimicrobiia bacterium]